MFRRAPSGDIMTGRQLYNAVKAAGAQLIDGPDHPASGWDAAAQLLSGADRPPLETFYLTLAVRLFGHYMSVTFHVS